VNNEENKESIRQINFSVLFSHNEGGNTATNSCVILELVTSTVISRTELSCWRKNYSSKATLLLSESHRYKHFTVGIMIWLIATKFPYLKWRWVFYLLRRCFLSSIVAKMWLYIWVTQRMSYKKQELLTLRDHLSSPPGSVLLIFLVFCVFLLCVFTLLVPNCDFRYDFRMKTMFGSYLSAVVCRRAHVLFTLFVVACT
jgi:hypothetical protein